MAYSIGTILYATDLGPRSLEVFQHAVGYARQFGAKMHVITCIEAIGDYANVTLDTYVPAEVIALFREDGIKRINEEIETRFNRHDAAHPDNTCREVIASVQIIEGSAADVVLSEQKRLNADLIVLGSHGHTALGEMLIGSVAHKVTVKSPVPVLLVPINQ